MMAGYLTNETVFTLTELPERLGIIGGGPIGCELAQTFARFGSRVTVFDVAPQILIREDADAATIVQDALVRDGVDLQLGVSIQQVDRLGGETKVVFDKDGAAESTLVRSAARRRRPLTECREHRPRKRRALSATRRGVVVDDRLRTSNRRIYAVGDVASKFKFTHVADALARIAVQNALFFGRKKASDLVVPWCTYTDPEVAHVGLYEDEAERARLRRPDAHRAAPGCRPGNSRGCRGGLPAPSDRERKGQDSRCDARRATCRRPSR